jgi:hypothetical protein
MRWTVSPRGENTKCSRVNGARGSSTIDNAMRWAERASRENRANHVCPANLMLYVIHV